MYTDSCTSYFPLPHNRNTNSSHNNLSILLKYIEWAVLVRFRLIRAFKPSKKKKRKEKKK